MQYVNQFHAILCFRSGDEPPCHRARHQSSTETVMGTHTQPDTMPRINNSICKFALNVEVYKQTGHAGMPQQIHVSAQHFPSDDERNNFQ
jgi:hypothetical protein